MQRCSPCLRAVRGLGGNFADLEGRRVGRKDVMARVDPLGRRKRLKLDRSKGASHFVLTASVRALPKCTHTHLGDDLVLERKHFVDTLNYQDDAITCETANGMIRNVDTKLLVAKEAKTDPNKMHV
jgi:hypothetical protein